MVPRVPEATVGGATSQSQWTCGETRSLLVAEERWPVEPVGLFLRTAKGEERESRFHPVSLTNGRDA